MKPPATDVSLADYVARMKEGQDKIYYLTGESYAQVKDSPHLEVFRKKGIEVLLLTDRIDEWLMGYLTEFDGKAFVDVARGDLDLGTLDPKKTRKRRKKPPRPRRAGEPDQGRAGRPSGRSARLHRLTDSPAILAIGQGDLGLQMRQMLEASGQKVPESKPVFEFNPEHPLIAKLDAEQDGGRFDDWPGAVRPGRAGRRRQPEGPGRLREAPQQAAAGAVGLSRQPLSNTHMQTPGQSWAFAFVAKTIGGIKRGRQLAPIPVRPPLRPGLLRGACRGRRSCAMRPAPSPARPALAMVSGRCATITLVSASRLTASLTC
jgi:hypothetical protein